MNYELWIDGATPIKLFNFTVPAEFRPRVGDVINPNADPLREYKVIRCNPTSNPDNVTVQYYVDIVSLDYPTNETRTLAQFNEPGVFYPNAPGLVDIS